MKLLVLCLGFASALTSLAPAALGQSATASLRGVVTDATNAVVPGAEVVITSIDTSQQHTQRSDSHGEFSFQELFVGDLSCRGAIP
jgi:type 1 fimbria pilin